MTDLKTLKDLTIQGDIDYETLRQEAIKWIKELDKENTGELGEIYEKFGFEFCDSGYDEYASTRYGHLIAWIKHFFNITDEDLR